MTPYEERLRRLAARIARAVLRLWLRVDEGNLPAAAFTDLTVGIISVGNRRGRTLARLTLRAEVEALTFTPSPVPDYPEPDDGPRLRKALDTIQESGLDTEMQLERLATDEPINAATTAFSDGIREHPLIHGWVREMDSDPCELCVWWWREGRVWHPDHPMPRHTGCACRPRPTTTRSNYQSKRQSEAALYQRATRERSTT